MSRTFRFVQEYLPFELRGDGWNVCLSLRFRDPGFQAREYAQAVAAAILNAIAECHGNPHLGAGGPEWREPEIAGHDSHHYVGFAIQCHGLPHGGRIPCKESCRRP